MYCADHANTTSSFGFGHGRWTCREKRRSQRKANLTRRAHNNLPKDRQTNRQVRPSGVILQHTRVIVRCNRISFTVLLFHQTLRLRINARPNASRRSFPYNDASEDDVVEIAYEHNNYGYKNSPFVSLWLWPWGGMAISSGHQLDPAPKSAKRKNAACTCCSARRISPPTHDSRFSLISRRASVHTASPNLVSADLLVRITVLDLPFSWGCLGGKGTLLVPNGRWLSHTTFTVRVW